MNDLLAAWSLPEGTLTERATSGLINETFVLTAPGGEIRILQRLNTKIFRPEVHEDIEAVTAWIASKGLATPRLLPTTTGALWFSRDNGECWRMMSFIGDRTVEKLRDPADARSAGALIGRFHAALQGFSWDFRMVRPGAHDTARHMARLRETVGQHTDHRLYRPVASLSRRILSSWGALDELGSPLPARVIHGDLKISNVRFAGPDALALIDLDTLAWGTLDVELGDAMRSWCNPDSEDSAHPRFDLDLFGAAMAGYADGSAKAPPTAAEWRAVVHGVERITLELASRFAQDALAESYFGFNPAYGGRGEHNLLRAQGQYALAVAIRGARGDAEALVAGLGDR